MTDPIQAIQERYRQIRKRFVDNFIIIGEGPGRSLPYWILLGRVYWTIWSEDVREDGGYYGSAIFRARQAHPDDHNQAEAMFDQEVGTRRGYSLYFSDTTIEQGQYLWLLATEAALLERQRDPNHDYRTALYYEIDCALEAVARLDRKAHEVFGKSSDGYQGYVLRDDAPVDLYLSAPGLGPSGTGFLPEDKHRFGSVMSELIEAEYKNDWPAAANSLHATMSQDQLLYLLAGLALMHQLVPSTAPSTISGGSLLEKTRRLISGFVEKLARDQFLITAPDGTKNKIAGRTKASGLAAGMFKAAHHVLGREIIGAAKLNELIAIFKTINALPLNGNNRKMYRMGACLGAIHSIDQNVKHCLDPINQYDVYPLVRALIWDERMSEECEEKLRASLLAKLANFPANPGSRPETMRPWTIEMDVAPGWARGSRWVHLGVEQTMETPHPRGDPWAFPGVDFMLAYNLYHLYFHPIDRTYRPYTGWRRVVPEFGEFSLAPSAHSSPLPYAPLPDHVRDSLHHDPATNLVYYRGVDSRMYMWWQGSRPTPIHPTAKPGGRVVYALDRNKIYHRGGDGRLYNFYKSGSNWAHAPLRNDVTNATDDFVVIPGAIVYRGTDNRAWRLFWDNGQWNHQCVNPNVRNLAGLLLWHSGRLFYKGSDNMLHQLSPTSFPWAHWTTTQSAQGIKDNLFYAAGDHNRFFYRGLDNRLHWTKWQNGAWQSAVVHPEAGDVGDTVHFNPADQRLYYFGNMRRHLHEVYSDNGTWKHQSSQSLENDATSNFFIAQDGQRIYVACHDGGLVYYFKTDGGWKPVRTSVEAHPIAGPLVGDNGEQHIYFRSQLGQLGWFER